MPMAAYRWQLVGYSLGMASAISVTWLHRSRGFHYSLAVVSVSSVRCGPHVAREDSDARPR